MVTVIIGHYCVIELRGVDKIIFYLSLILIIILDTDSAINQNFVT